MNCTFSIRGALNWFSLTTKPFITMDYLKENLWSTL